MHVPPSRAEAHLLHHFICLHLWLDCDTDERRSAPPRARLHGLLGPRTSSLLLDGLVSQRAMVG